jgi:hypothetical protein
VDVLVRDEYNERLRPAMERALDRFVEKRVADDVDARNIVAIGGVQRRIRNAASRSRTELIVMSLSPLAAILSAGYESRAGRAPCGMLGPHRETMMPTRVGPG